MWETIRFIITQWGLAGAMAACVGFFIYVLYIDKGKKLDKEVAREKRLDQMTDRVISITSEVSMVVAKNTEVFREVIDRLKELKEANISDHRYIIDKMERSDASTKNDHHRIEDKIDDNAKR